jgi:excisionase family DNA binding protein
MEQQTTPDPIMTLDELAQYLRVSAGHLYNKWKVLGIPAITVLGKKCLRFRKSQVDIWLESGSQNLMSQQAAPAFTRSKNK